MCIDNLLAVGLLILVNISLGSTFTALGPGNVIVERLELCDDAEKYAIENNLIMKKINRTTAGVTGCIQLPEELGITSSMQIDISKWGDGGWKPNAYNLNEQDACKFLLKFLKTTVEDVLKFNGIENKGCPIQKNNLCVEKLVLSLGKVFPSVLYGKFRADGIIFIDSKPMFCLRAFAESTPRVAG